MNYNRLWKLLIDKNMKKKDLREATGLTTNTIAKMGKGGDVSTQVLRKICEVLDCKIEDIVELEHVHTKESKIMANRIKPAKTISSLS